MNKLQKDIATELKHNFGKLSYDFIQGQVEHSVVKYLHPTPNMRLCIISLPSGHEVIGVAQVLYAKNDDETIGNSVALKNATDELWKVFGSIAKVTPYE